MCKVSVCILRPCLRGRGLCKELKNQFLKVVFSYSTSGANPITSELPTSSLEVFFKLEDFFQNALG
jgi:hypothetical protein